MHYEEACDECISGLKVLLVIAYAYAWTFLLQLSRRVWPLSGARTASWHFMFF
jgi:hypothetical protein